MDFNTQDTGSVRFIGEVKEVDGKFSVIRLYDEYCDGLLHIEDYSHLYILYWFHERDNEKHRQTIQVIPRRHGQTTLRGVFASRSPSRPNPVGLCIVRLHSFDGCEIKVENLDAFQGSPIVDIKPYLPRNDIISDAKAPEWFNRGPEH